MRYRRHVLNRGHKYAGALDCADGRFTTGTGASDKNFDLSQTVVHAFSGGVFTGTLRRERSGFSRAGETDSPSASPGNSVALRIGQCDDGVIESRLDVCPSNGHRFALSAPGSWSSCHLVKVL